MFGQFGPGGIGDVTSNGTWLTADNLSGLDGSPVSSWTDISGNTNNADQLTADEQPQFFNTSAINGMPILRFDGLDDQMAIPDQDIFDNSNGLTYFVVLRPNNLNGFPRGILDQK